MQPLRRSGLVRRLTERQGRRCLQRSILFRSLGIQHVRTSWAVALENLARLSLMERYVSFHWTDEPCRFPTTPDQQPARLSF